MSSRYPAQVDSSLNLPTVTDNFTPVSGGAVNRIRDAIINIESELGVKPSGTFGTVRARLDLLEKTSDGVAGLNEVNGSYALTIADKNLITVFVTTPGVTATLPVASTVANGDLFTVANATGNDLFVSGNGTQIYGAGSLELLNDSESRIYCFNSGAISGLVKWMRI